MRDIADLQESVTWKIQLTIEISFNSSKDVDDDCVMHPKSNNMKFTVYNKANEVVNKLFKSLLSRYQDNLETSMTGSDFIFDSVQLMYYKFRKVNFRCSGSYIDSPV